MYDLPVWRYLPVQHTAIVQCYTYLSVLSTLYHLSYNLLWIVGRWLNDNVVIKYPWSPGPPREILQGGTRLYWGHGNRLRLLSNLRIWGPGYNVNVNYHQQPEFRNLSEFYILVVIFLNKLKIVENIPKNWGKNQNKTPMAKAMMPFKNSQTPSWLSGPRTDVPTDPPLISSADPCVLSNIVYYVSRSQIYV